MRDDSWLAAFAHELEAAGVDPLDRAATLVETEGFLADSAVGAYDHFGPPGSYAATIAAALGATGRPRPAADPNGPAAVTVDGVSKSYRGRPVLVDVSMRVGRGEVVVLTGPNGAGKSTLLGIIAGVEQPDRGSVELAGPVGWVPQQGGLDPYLRPEEHFELFGAASGLGPAAARTEGHRLARELAWDAAAAPVAGELSGGTQQKLGVILAMLGRPDTLLLDEPYQGLDADSQRRFWDLLWTWQDNGGTAVVSSHSPDAVARATRVVEIEGLPAR